jgi:hypothetical protein
MTAVVAGMSQSSACKRQEAQQGRGWQYQMRQTSRAAPALAGCRCLVGLRLTHNTDVGSSRGRGATSRGSRRYSFARQRRQAPRRTLPLRDASALWRAFYSLARCSFGRHRKLVPLCDTPQRLAQILAASIVSTRAVGQRLFVTCCWQWYNMVVNYNAS